MNRRGFLSALLGAVTGAAFDPERALWVPGRKKIFIPPLSRNVIITPESFARITLTSLRDSLRLARAIQREHNRQFSAIAGTIEIRRPYRFA